MGKMTILHSSIPRATPFSACRTKPDCVVHLRLRHRAETHVIRAICHRHSVEKAASCCLDKVCRLAVAGVLASGFVSLSPLPAEADMQVVSPQMVTQMARPLPKQSVDKGKIWSVFVGGAILLFGITVVAENSEALFPAIARANKSLRMAAKQIDDMEERQKKEDEVLRLRQAQYDEEQRQLALVQQGMQKARTKVLAPGAAIEPLLEQSKATQPPSSMLDAPVDLPGSSALIESRSEPSVPASTSSIPYVVVDTVVPDMGAMAWPTAATVVPAVHSTSAHAEAVPCSPFPEAGNGNGGQATAITAVAPSEDDAEALARLARLQGFVSGTMSGGMSPLEAYKAQRQ